MYSGGVYLDRSNSLLASLTFRDQAPHQVVLNLYPGAGGGFLEDLGLWAKVHKRDFRVGIVHRWPGFGVGAGY